MLGTYSNGPGENEIGLKYAGGLESKKWSDLGESLKAEAVGLADGL